MKQDMHEQARQLIALADRQDLPERQQTALRIHLRECAACREFDHSAGQVIRALRSQPLPSDWASLRAAQRRVGLRTIELAAERKRRQLVIFSCALVGLSAALTTSLAWREFAWAGSWAGVAEPVWQTGFLLFWIAPALLASALLMAHGSYLGDNGEEQGERERLSRCN